MKEADIRKYAGLMEELGLTGLEITENNQVVRLERILQSAPTMPMPCPQPIPQKERRKNGEGSLRLFCGQREDAARG